jgi:hypothetical protein
MVGLDPTIHATGWRWILGSSPRMTEVEGGWRRERRGEDRTGGEKR